MANARKCDRCGKFYDPFEMDGMLCRFQNPVFQNTHDIQEGMIGKLLMNASPDTHVDLCPECAELFEAFMCCSDLPIDSERYLEMQQHCDWLAKRADDYAEQLTIAKKRIEELEGQQNEKESKALIADILATTLDPLGLGDFIRRSVRGGDTDGDQTVCDSKPAERKGKTKQESED